MADPLDEKLKAIRKVEMERVVNLQLSKQQDRQLPQKIISKGPVTGQIVEEEEITSTDKVGRAQGAVTRKSTPTEGEEEDEEEDGDDESEEDSEKEDNAEAEGEGEVEETESDKADEDGNENEDGDDEKDDEDQGNDKEEDDKEKDEEEDEEEDGDDESEEDSENPESEEAAEAGEGAEAGEAAAEAAEAAEAGEAAAGAAAAAEAGAGAAAAAGAGTAAAATSPIWGIILGIVLLIGTIIFFVFIIILVLVAQCNEDSWTGTGTRAVSKVGSWIGVLPADVCENLAMNNFSGGSSGGAGASGQFETISIVVTSAYRPGAVVAGTNRLSAHGRGEAIDIALRNPNYSANDARLTQLLQAARSIGFAPPAGDTLDEYTNPTEGASGGHVHIEFNTQGNNTYCDNTAVNNPPTDLVPIPASIPVQGASDPRLRPCMLNAVTRLFNAVQSSSGN